MTDRAFTVVSAHRRWQERRASHARLPGSAREPLATPSPGACVAEARSPPQSAYYATTNLLHIEAI